MTPADLPAVRELNDAAVPAVPPTTVPELAQLVAHAALALVEDRGAGPEAFLVAVAPGADYDSENYRWFEAQGVPHLYIDRIVVGESLRGAGVGRALYGAVDARARELGAQRVTCEVNLVPPNPESLAFHARMGFERAGEQWTKGDTTQVALLTKSL